MKSMIRWLSLSVLALSVSAQAGALSSKLAEAGGDWLLGTWTGATEDGYTFTLTYAQVFDGQAGSVHFKGEGMEMKGLIAVDPSSDEVRQFAVTSSGELITGTWSEEGGGLSLDVSWVAQDGSYKQRTYVYSRVDAETVKVVMYDGQRWRSDTTKYEIELKRSS